MLLNVQSGSINTSLTLVGRKVHLENEFLVKLTSVDTQMTYF